MFGYRRVLDHLSYKAVLGFLRSALCTKNLSYCPFSLFNYIYIFFIHFVYSQNFYTVFMTFIMIILRGWDISLKFMKDCIVFSHVLNNTSVWCSSVRRPKLVTLEITVHRISTRITMKHFVCTYTTKCFLKGINIHMWKSAVIVTFRTCTWLNHLIYTGSFKKIWMI